MIFKIKKGNHYSQLKIKLWFGKRLFTWPIKFDDSCKYDFKDDDNYDINKLVGIGWLPHIWADSIRFGWVYNNQKDQVDVYAYCYVKSIRNVKFITSVNINEIYNYTIEIGDSNYQFTVNNITVSIDHSNKKLFQYLLRPFFGGNKPAQQDITIHIG